MILVSVLRSLPSLRSPPPLPRIRISGTNGHLHSLSHCFTMFVPCSLRFPSSSWSYPIPTDRISMSMYLTSLVSLLESPVSHCSPSASLSRVGTSGPKRPVTYAILDHVRKILLSMRRPVRSNSCRVTKSLTQSYSCSIKPLNLGTFTPPQASSVDYPYALLLSTHLQCSSQPFSTPSPPSAPSAPSSPPLCLRQRT